MHVIPCTPITKDAKNYVLQDCLGDLVLFLHICCGFGLPVPLFLLYRVVRQSRFALPSSSLFALSFIVGFAAHIFPTYAHHIYCDRM